jgi:hypothetical protein
MTKLEAIAAAKQFRKDADELLQRMKEHRRILIETRSQEGRSMSQQVSIKPHGELFEDANEAIAQHTLSIRDLESAIMRQGMALKYIGNPDPYPESRNPDSPVVEPTADGLKL